MGFVKGSFFVGLLFFLNCGFCVFGNEQTKFYIVHLGARQHDDPDLVAESHLKMLESVFESVEDARKSIIYNYQHGFSGFAARLTESQAKKLSERPDVVQVGLSHKLRVHSTRISDYLGLSPGFPKGILHESNMGHDLVLGIIDSGIWPESESYNDVGLGPIPKHWKGACVAGEQFDPAKHCNKKLVGAKYFFEGWADRRGSTTLGEEDYMSPRGVSNHGTMTSTISASSFVHNVSVKGLAPGLMRGTAPKARIASYKVVWQGQFGAGGVANIAKAMDEAVKDGVDVISISIGTAPLYGPLSPTDHDTDLELGSFHAVVKGIPVIAAAGNDGPEAYKVSNIPPWLITVAATSLDRTFLVDMTFGNNLTITAHSDYIRAEISRDLVYVQDWKNVDTKVKGKIYLTFVKTDAEVDAAINSLMINADGVIIARTSDQKGSYPGGPVVLVDYEVGSEILQYIHASSSPTVRISPAKTLVGLPVATTLAGFSSRGPSALSPAILKPDIAAPGLHVVGANTQINPTDYPKYELGTGTSFATPVVSGIVVLLKALHPDWSPAALKSAIMTTAWKTAPSGEPIFAVGSQRKLADPFDYGAGLVNPERAKDPGLIYDMNIDDYIIYFCAVGYNETAISLLAGKPTKCGTPLPSILDINYPAITIPDLIEEVTITRKVTNVGPVDSVYRAVIEAPRGIKIAVEPETLKFSSTTKILGFKVRVSASHKANTGFKFGNFIWTDGTHNVSIPLSVRSRTGIPKS